MSPKNEASVSVQEKGKTERELKREDWDPYPEIWTPGEEVPHSRVELSVSKGFDFGSLRVTARTSLVCDQKSETLDRAGVLAFEKAYAFACDGFDILMAETKAEPT